MLPAIASVVFTGCSASSAIDQPRTTSTSPSTSAPRAPVAPLAKLGRPAWIIEDSAVALLRRSGLSASLTDYFFNNPSTFLIQNKETRVRRELPRAVAVESFTSYHALQRALYKGTMDPGIRAIMYDNELWNLTPSNESSHPALFGARARALAHRLGMTFIFTPATDLANANSTRPTAGAAVFQQYLADHLAARGARVSDVFEIQAQRAEATPEFLPFATRAVAQARTANPHAEILLGVASSPGGRSVTSQDLLDAYRSTRSMVAGYWLNIPLSGPGCTDCGGGDPQVAVAFLRSLAQMLGR